MNAKNKLFGYRYCTCHTSNSYLNYHLLLISDLFSAIVSSLSIGQWYVSRSTRLLGAWNASVFFFSPINSSLSSCVRACERWCFHHWLDWFVNSIRHTSYCTYMYARTTTGMAPIGAARREATRGKAGKDRRKATGMRNAHAGRLR